MRKKRYIVIEDRQGGEFGMYRDYTLEQWKEQAIEWAETDDWDDAQNLFDGMTSANEIIAFIDDMWEITIVELNNSKEVIDYLTRLENCDDWTGHWAKKLLKQLKNREYQQKFFKKNRKKVIAKQQQKRKQIREEKIKNGTLHNNENLRGNILNKIYTHPKNTYTRTELYKMKKSELKELLNRLERGI